MGDTNRDGLLRGTPPYPWWQWVLGGIGWGTVMFLAFVTVTGFRAVAFQAVMCALGAIGFVLGTRHLIVRRERREGRLPPRGGE